MITIPIWLFALGIAGLVVLGAIAAYGIYFIFSFVRSINWLGGRNADPRVIVGVHLNPGHRPGS